MAPSRHARVLAAVLTLTLPVHGLAHAQVTGRGEPLTLAAHADAMARAEICGIEISDRGLVEVENGFRKLAAEAGMGEAHAREVMATVKAGLEKSGVDCSLDNPDIVPVYEAIVFYEDRARRADNQTLLLDSLAAILTVVAAIEYCQIQIPGEIAARMGSHAIELEDRLGMTEEESHAAYGVRLEEIRAERLDCSEDGPVRENIAKAVRFFGG